MGDVVNLRRARKAQARDKAQSAAQEARARHGRTRLQRLAEQAEADRLARTVENSRREPVSASDAMPGGGHEG